jgi:hypothetical protein
MESWMRFRGKIYKQKSLAGLRHSESCQALLPVMLIRNGEYAIHLRMIRLILLVLV